MAEGCLSVCVRIQSIHPTAAIAMAGKQDEEEWQELLSSHTTTPQQQQQQQRAEATRPSSKQSETDRPTQPAACRKKQTQDSTANVRADEEEWQELLSSHTTTTSSKPRPRVHSRRPTQPNPPPADNRSKHKTSKLTWALAEPTAAIRRTALAIFMMMNDSRDDTV
jgi:hypothetical protein